MGCSVLRSDLAFVDFADHAVVDFGDASFRRTRVQTGSPPPYQDTILKSLIYRPTTYQRNEIRWIAAHGWRSGRKKAGMAALRLLKQNPDAAFISAAAQPISALIRQLFGMIPADAVTCIPCGHSRRPDCFGKRLAQAVARELNLPFIQLFADVARPGSSHPKKSANLPGLKQISVPPRSVIVVDDLATSGRHLEQAVSTLRNLSVTASAVAWISGSMASRAAVSTSLARDLPQRRPRRVAEPAAPIWG